MKIKEKLLKFWYFHVKNPVIRKGETKGGAFRWTFRRFWLEIETLSGNFKAKFTADENPYAYLLAGQDDENIIGFCQCLYMVGTLLTTDAGFASDIGKAISKYQKRLENAAKREVVEDESEEKIALEEVKAVQEHIELPAKERRKVERDINGRFEKAVKAQNLQGEEA